MSIHDDIETIDALEKNIYRHVGYRQQWKVYPMDDKRNAIWWTDGDVVKFCPTREKLMLWLTEGDDAGECYSNEVIREGIYRGAEITAIEVDTNTDGNKFLMLLRNENEVKYER